MANTAQPRKGSSARWGLLRVDADSSASRRRDWTAAARRHAARAISTVGPILAPVVAGGNVIVGTDGSLAVSRSRRMGPTVAANDAQSVAVGR
jgi:hypothetical protein